MTDQKPITLSQAIEQVLAQLDGPIAVDELAQRVLAIYPSKAKKPAASLRNTLRWNHIGKTLVYLDRQTIIPLRIAMKGVRFRVRITPQEAQRSVLFIHPAFDYFLRRGIAPQNVQLLNATSQLLAFRAVTIEEKRKDFFGDVFTTQIAAFDLSDWFRANRVRGDDSILVTIEDWEAGCFRLEHEPASRRRREEIERKNQELANVLFDMLEDAHDERLRCHHDVLTAYARLSDPRGYPGDHWIEVIARDPRMAWDGSSIRYSDAAPSPLESLMLDLEGADTTLPEKPYTRAQARQIYRFKAALWHRPGLWRRIEIQGGQTLAEFDGILRDAFNHDPMDHLGGFWKLIRRGTGKRFREVDLGDVDPMGRGSGARTHIAGVGLKPGDELKYVYDFGDWIQHRLTLEEIGEQQKGVKYPRIVEQNKPQYKDCQSCKAQGRKTRATWICIECSNEQQQAVLVCEDCLEAEHEDHYADEITY